MIPSAGGRYTSDGFEPLWQRCVNAALAGIIFTAQTRFTFNDLRSIYATKHKKVTGELPDLHKNKETTARVYDRSTEVFRSAN